MKKLFNLQNLLLLTIFCAPLYLIKVNLLNFSTNLLELLALLAIITTFLQKRTAFKSQFLKLPKIFLLGSVLIIFGLLLSILLNDNHLVGLGIFKSWFVLPVIFSFALYLTMNSEKDVEKIYLSLYLSAAAVGIIAIIYKLFGIVTYDNRLTAFYLSPNYLAMYLSSGLFFGFYFSIKSFLQKNFSKTFFLHSAPPVVILIPIFYTFSYGAWLSIIVALAIVLWMLKPFRKNILLGILLLLFCGFLLFFSQVNTQKFTSFSQFSSRSSFASRMMIWNSSALLIKENPIFGIGPGNFQNSYLAVQKYFPPYLEWAVPQPHNIFLAFWLQAGLLGFVGFLMLLFFIFKTLWQLLSNKKSAVLAAPLLGFFLYTILHGLIDTTYWKNDLAFLFWICLFIMLSIKEFSNEQK